MNDIVELNNRVTALFNKIKYLFDEEAVKTIKNFLENYEYEMAFEAIFIELREIKDVPNQLKQEEALNLGLDLNLNLPENVVLDDNFWEKFLEYIYKI